MLAAVGNSRASLNGDLGPSYGNPVPPLQDLYLSLYLYSYGNPVPPLQDLYLSLYLYSYGNPVPPLEDLYLSLYLYL